MFFSVRLSLFRRTFGSLPLANDSSFSQALLSKLLSSYNHVKSRRGTRKVLFFSVFQCIWRAAFSSLLFMNIFRMIVMSFGVATHVTTCLYFSCIVASCGNRCYTYSLLRCCTIYLFACSQVFFSIHLVLVQRTFCSPRIAHDSTFSLDLLSMRVHAQFACCRGPYGKFS